MVGGIAVVWFPKHKDGLRHNVAKHAEKCKALGADVRYLENPTQMSINWYRIRAVLEEEYGNGAKLLPQGLPFDETVNSVEKEADAIPASMLGGTVVMCAGSGVMAAGVARSLIKRSREQDLYGSIETQLVCVPVSSQDKVRLKEKIFSRIKLPFLRSSYGMVRVTDDQWAYEDEAEVDCPFPCSPNYDLKAWKYLVENVGSLKPPILFWNIGG
jgi:hypothetical protein